jgi:hypothetical protein
LTSVSSLMLLLVPVTTWRTAFELMVTPISRSTLAMY